MVEVLELSDAEITTIPDRTLTARTSKRIREFARAKLTETFALDTPPRTLSSEYATSRTVQTINNDVYDSLRHPVVLGCLARMDENTIDAALSGDTAAMYQLSQRYIEWFCLKAKRRRQQIDESQARTILAAAVKHRGITSAFGDFQKDWIIPAKAAAGSDLAARYMFEEASSAGVIVSDGSLNQWRWRNPFLCEVLT